MRHIVNVKPRPLLWRNSHPFLIAHAAAFQDEVVAADGSVTGSLVATGYVRGRAFRVGQLVHIAEVGTFPIAALETLPEAADSGAGGGAGKLAPEPRKAWGSALFPEIAEPPAMLATADGLAGEQTWPTKEELDEARRARGSGGDGDEDFDSDGDGDDDDDDDDGDDDDEDGDDGDGDGDDDSDIGDVWGTTNAISAKKNKKPVEDDSGASALMHASCMAAAAASRCVRTTRHCARRFGDV